MRTTVTITTPAELEQAVRLELKAAEKRLTEVTPKSEREYVKGQIAAWSAALTMVCQYERTLKEQEKKNAAALHPEVSASGS